MDARVRYTKSVIRTVFFELLKTQPIDKITVSEICTRAEINRGTFYKHYDNAYDLLNKLELEILDHLQETINTHGSREYSAVFRIVLVDIVEKKDIYKILFSENGDALFKERLFEECYENGIDSIRSYFPELESEKSEWVYYFLAEGCMGILSRWINGDMQQDTEEVVGFLSNVINAVNKAVL